MSFGRMGRDFGRLGVGSNNANSWVLSGAAIGMDFAKNRYFGGTASSLLTISRASNATDLLPSSASGYAYNTYSSNVLVISPSVGLLCFESRTNLFLNSTAPATQTITLSATGNYTLWVNGSGSAAIAAGTATITGAGTATNGSPVTINCTATGTVTVTVTGSLNFAQLEAGAAGTSGIVTAGASATRAADNIGTNGALKTLLTTAPLSIVTQTFGLQAPYGSGRIIAGNGAIGLITTGSSTTMSTYNGSVVLNCTLGSGSPTGIVKTGVAFGTSTGRSIVANNGTVATDSGGSGVGTNALLGSQSGTSNFADGATQSIFIWGSQLADATLKAFTQ